MNENLKQEFSKLHDLKDAMTKPKFNINNLDMHIFVQHEIALIRIVNTLTNIETVLILCDILKIELPVDIYDTYSKKIDKYIHLINEFNN